MGGGNQLWEIFTSRIWNIVAWNSTTGGPIDKWSLQADSALKTGLDSMFQEVLTVVESGGSATTKKLGIFKNGSRLCLLLNNQRPNGPMELTGGFSVKNWASFHLPRNSDCSGEWSLGGDKRLRNLHWQRGAISASGDVRTRCRDPGNGDIL